MPSTNPLPVLFAVHPSQYQSFSTAELRRYFLLTDLAKVNSINLIYTHYDRLIAGTIIPENGGMNLPSFENLKSNFFLERRELGVINVGGKGNISVEGKIYSLEKYDCLYIGMGSKEIIFSGVDAKASPLFYLLSSPAHAGYATTLMKAQEASPLEMGSDATSNARTIYKYIYMDGIQSCQLVMGLTILKKGSVWNTMPSHIHDRRAEIYFYFDLAEDQRIMHFMGEPHQTRNIVIANNEAVASPSWSIHSGCGTSNYSFVWGMAGENKDYTDMDPFPAASLF
jgi:4-deoxy-L-threo-5-hexosulose-uronate ketol-isomerase